jgi:hypothetical protein
MCVRLSASTTLQNFVKLILVKCSKSVDIVQVWLGSDENKTIYMKAYVRFVKVYCVRDKYVKYS